MLKEHFYCVIMAGGTGSRFWPISRTDKPKQFLDFTSTGESFLRLTYNRMKATIPEDNILVVSLERYRDIVMEHLPELKERNLLLEPYGRNTAPCLTFATYTLLKRDPLAVMVATPSDQVIGNAEVFNHSIENALSYAAGTDAIITLGIVPTRPDANFGYIQTAGPFKGNNPVKVKTFTEKPGVELAKVFIESGEFVWNSGIFVSRASAMRDELETHAPDITRLWKGWRDALDSENQKDFLRKVYLDCPRSSIDYSVMEKTASAWVYPTEFKWADIGNWESLYDHLSHHDEEGNASNFTGKSLLKNSHKNILYSSKKGKLTAINGLDDYIVIDTDDVLFICPRDDAYFKNFLSELGMPEYSDYK
ncbi:MAG: mannose-1-phosphate guanylyltransferase [Bacteroidales bacterium]|nr:mannose-1-phosphate guanylyltransferase [Bacteroidales bacterium]